MAAHHDTEEPVAMLTPEVFASLEKPRYRDFDLLGFEVENEIEDLERYEPGGFCPIDLSLRDEPKFINDRFQVIYKLGFGGFGTVWLCYDVVFKAWRALKVHQATQSATSQPPGSCRDLLVSQTLKRESVSVEDALDNGVAMPLETFWIESPNGRHLCTVLPLLGPRLSDLMDHMAGDDPGRINHISYQIVKGMDFLHRHGICHGDFRPQNVLLRLKDGCFDDLGVDEMRQLLGRPGMVDIELEAGGRSPHAPEYAVTCINWESLWQYVSDDIAIVDFGESYETTNLNPHDLGIPRRYAAPEIIIGGDKGVGTDLWALGCTLMDLRCRGLPSTLPYTSDLIERMEDWLGPCLPPFRLRALQKLYASELEEWESHGGEGKTPKPEFPDSAEAGNIQPSAYITKISQRDSNTGVRDGPEDPIKTELSQEHTGGFIDNAFTTFRLTEEEINTFGDLLHKIFQWDPQQRWNTARIMNHALFASRQTKLQSNTVSLLNRHPDVESRPSTSIENSEVAPAKPALQDSNDRSSRPKPHVQEGQSILSRLRPWLQTLAIGSYFLGGFATLIFFVAYMIASQSDFLRSQRNAAPLAVPPEPVTVVVHIVR
ncbi:SRSF protein kinase 3 [Apiospora marii]|uniref:EKC/KEOPS complex subunit BUD32 n=1 Tax=Apiospora marii TaxID=335849 RepID=A0ABR1RLZ2_9PEZI